MPKMITPIANESGNARIKNLDLIALRRAEEAKVAFHMLVDSVNAVELSAMVVIDDDLLVLVLAAQLCDHGLSEC